MNLVETPGEGATSGNPGVKGLCGKVNPWHHRQKKKKKMLLKMQSFFSFFFTFMLFTIVK